tara:strand:- start:2803 stop:4119 length:1317 start_codon:yes stop_codon:yes gene_type:complete
MGSDWKEVSLGEIGRVVTGKTPKTKVIENFGHEIPFITPRDMDDQRIISETERYLSKVGSVSVKNSIIPANSISVSCIGSDMGKSAITKYLSVTNQQINSIVVSDEFYYKFVYYNLSSRKAEIRGLAGGSAQPILNKSDFSQIKMFVPPLTEQKAIAYILGSLDDKIELNRQMNETLEAMAQALFKSWFVDFDPVIDNALAAGNAIPDEFVERAEQRKGIEKKDHSDTQNLFPDEFEFSEEMGWIPRGWMVESFGDVSICFDRLRIPLSKKQRESKKPGVIPYHGATSVMDYINEWILDDIYLLIGEDGSVIKEDGSPFVQYIWGKTWVNNHAHVLQGKNGVGTEHLMLFMQSQNLTAYITGAVQLKINQGNMNRIPFLNSGSKINEKFTAIINPYYEKVRITAEENETLVKLRDTLLPKLMSGELRITDAEALVENV